MSIHICVLSPASSSSSHRRHDHHYHRVVVVVAFIFVFFHICLLCRGCKKKKDSRLKARGRENVEKRLEKEDESQFESESRLSHRIEAGELCHSSKWL